MHDYRVFRIGVDLCDQSSGKAMPEMDMAYKPSGVWYCTRGGALQPE